METGTATNPSEKNAIVVGAGIGGLTTGLALVRHGWRVQLLEAASALQEVGAGLQLSPNAMRVLDALGVGEAVRAASFEPEALELRLGRSGRQVFRIPTGEAARARWGAPYLHIHRADLIGTLATALEAAAPGQISLNAAVEAYTQKAGEVQITLASGDQLAAQLVVGADGIHSKLREQMLGPDAPHFTGNIAWRATVPLDQLTEPPPPTACVWAGKGRHAVTYRLRGGTLANFVGVVERNDWQQESWSEQGSKADALADFSNWSPTITDLIDKADTHYRWALFDREPLPRWHDGAIALLGDACHPMLPFMAQGAAMAIEDAWMLAACVSGDRSVSAGLADYQARRLPRTAKMQAASRANMKTFHRRSSLSRLATYGPMWLAGHVLPGFVRSRQDWIYGHDVTRKDR